MTLIFILNSARKSSLISFKCTFQIYSSDVSFFLESDPVPETVAQLAQEVYNNDILQLLVLNIWRFEFEVSVNYSLVCVTILLPNKLIKSLLSI